MANTSIFIICFQGGADPGFKDSLSFDGLDRRSFKKKINYEHKIRDKQEVLETRNH